MSAQPPYIPERWTFEDDKVAAIFDRHVREQLPWYDMATTAVAQIARHYIGAGGLVYERHRPEDTRLYRLVEQH